MSQVDSPTAIAVSNLESPRTMLTFVHSTLENPSRVISNKGNNIIKPKTALHVILILIFVFLHHFAKQLKMLSFFQETFGADRQDHERALSKRGQPVSVVFTFFTFCSLELRISFSFKIFEEDNPSANAVFQGALYLR